MDLKNDILNKNSNFKNNGLKDNRGNLKNSSIFSRLDEITKEMKAGKILVIVDDKGEEAEGVLFQAAEKATIESVNFFINYGKGLLYLACEQERLEKL
ncbi:MAG: 3,4-dihydroxy-2-butanone-4-phosphate synthase, partial [Actinomycetota bacterium]|nr:3,4-dihydroxy-2-butanone-4-phosphate synthase [Actinomycetota bacterium]